MNGEELKKKVRSGGIVYGTMLSMMRSPRWATPMAGFGLDFVIIDTEHTPRGRAEVADLIVAMQGTGIVPITRIPIPASHHVTMAIDAGAQGILAPYCETVEEVKDVVGATKWRPLKGALVRRVMDTGEFPSGASKKYLEERNKNNVCLIGIESPPAIDNLENILKVPGIDAIFVGPNDLTISLGIPDQYDHPKYLEAVRRVIKTCKKHGVPTLVHHHSVELTAQWLKEGARFVLHGSDARLMHNAVRAAFGELKAIGEKLSGQSAGDIGESDEVL
ncbi:MAG: hypothetical protein FJ317_04515 [SAR202 cluster bacterium]|nr:hypothetical protein [SAR202 cluster bacterium]